MIAVPVVLAFLATWVLLPAVRPKPFAVGIGAAAGALIALAALLLQQSGIWQQDLLFYVFAVMAIVSAGCMITQNNPVYAALWFALVVLNSCGLFLLQAAPFLAAATIIVYAGAIIVTFLFVIMLAQQTGIAYYDREAREPMLAALGGFVLLGALLLAVRLAFPQDGPASPLLDALAQRRKDSQIVLTKLDQATLLLQQGESPEIVSFVLYEDPKRPETAVGAKLHTQTDHLQPPIQEKLRGELEAVRTRLGVAQGLGKRDDILQALAEMRTLAVELQARTTGSTLSQAKDATELGAVRGLGRSLFTDYLWAVELAGNLLLIATIGAILIASRRREGLT